MSTFFDARDFLAAGDGVADDTTEILAAVAAASAAGGGCVYLHGAHKISASIVLPLNVNLRGDGKNVTWLLPTSRNIDAVVYSPPGVTETEGVNQTRAKNATPTLEGFSIQYPALDLPPLVNGVRRYTDNGKYAIRLQAQDAGTGTLQEPAKNVTQPTIRDVGIVNAPNGILLNNELGGLIDNGIIDNFETVGIEIDSPDSKDGGGVTIRSTPIVNYQGYPANLDLVRGTAIVWRSGGALKILDGSIACVNDGIRALFDGDTSQLMVDRINFDTFFHIAVWLSRNQAFPNARLTVVKITNNEFAGPNAIYADTDSVQWLSDVVCDNNLFRGAADQAVAQIYLDGVAGGSIRHGYHRSNKAGTTGIILGVHTTGIRYGRNIQEPPAMFSADQNLGAGNTALASP
jgi:hypothetical protein